MKGEVKLGTEAGESKSTELSDKSSQFVDERLNPDGTSVFMCTLTLIGTRIGAGIVGLPYAVQALGPSVGLCFHFLYCFITLGGVFLLLRSRMYIGKSTYAEIGAFCFGNISIYIMNVLITIGQLGLPIIYFIVFGDVLSGLIHRVNTSNIAYFESRWFTHPLLGILMLYLVLLKKLKGMKYTALFLLVILVIFMILFFIHYLITNPQPSKKIDYEEVIISVKWFSTIPTIVSNWGFLSAYFTSFGALKNQSSKNGFKVAVLGMILMGCIFVFSPILAFGVYGKSVKSNLLLSIAADEGAIPVILLFIFLIVAVVQVPIIFFNGKEALMAIISEALYKTYSNIMNKDKVNKDLNLDVPNEYVINHDQSHLEDNKESQHEGQNEPHHEDNKESEHYNNYETNQDIKNPKNHNQQDEENHEVHRASEIKKVSPEDHDTHNENKNPQKDVAYADASHQQEYLKHIKWYTYYPVTIIAYVIIILLSIVVGDVKLFFGLLGSIVSCFFAIAGPGTFYIIAIHKLKLKIDSPLKILLYVMAWIYVVVGYTHVIGLTICVIIVNV